MQGSKPVVAPCASFPGRQRSSKMPAPVTAPPHLWLVLSLLLFVAGWVVVGSSTPGAGASSPAAGAPTSAVVPLPQCREPQPGAPLPIGASSVVVSDDASAAAWLADGLKAAPCGLRADGKAQPFARALSFHRRYTSITAFFHCGSVLLLPGYRRQQGGISSGTAAARPGPDRRAGRTQPLQILLFFRRRANFAAAFLRTYRSTDLQKHCARTQCFCPNTGGARAAARGASRGGGLPARRAGQRLGSFTAFY